MTQQKIPLFDGLIQACHDGIGVAEASTTIFTPPDKTLAPGSQSFYALHLWLKPAIDAQAPTGEAFDVRVIRGSVPADERIAWSSNRDTMNQVTGLSTGLTNVPSQNGVPVKVLDGYLVRGDVVVKLVTSNAAADHFAAADGTKMWGYFQRIGADIENWRHIGDPPVGPLFDTGLPALINAGATVKVHDFEPDRIDEIFLALVDQSGDANAVSVTIILADSNDDPLAEFAIELSVGWKILGAPNGIRDPASMYDFYGCFGNNEDLASILIKNDGAGSVFVHGRFARH